MTAGTIGRIVRHTVPASIPALALLLLAFQLGGAWPRTLMLPGALVIGWAACGAIWGALPQLRSRSGVGLAALVVLTATTWASQWWATGSTWAPREEAARTAVLAAGCIGSACWLGDEDRRRTAAQAIAMSCGAVALSSLVRMAMLDDARHLFTGYRLDAPVAYVNGLAAICVLGFLLASGWAVESAVSRERARERTRLAWLGTIPLFVATACATACAATLLLTQSRAGIASLALGVTALIALSHYRTWALALVGLPLLATGGAAHWLARPFQALGSYTRATWRADHPAADQLRTVAAHSIRDAGGAALIACALCGIACVTYVITRERRRDSVSATTPRAHPHARIAATVATGALLVGSLALPQHGPVGWAIGQVRGCAASSAGTPDRSGDTRGSHFTDVGSGRCDFWRVALDDATTHPFAGVGAGGFEDTYARHGRTGELPRSAHSIELSAAGELGALGIGLLLVFAGATIASARRVRATDAAPIAALIAWSAHASVDWLWQLPVSSLPALALAGSLLGAAAARQHHARTWRAASIAAVSACIALALVLVPGRADEALRRSEQLTRTHPTAALHHARIASRRAPGWAAPHIRAGLLLARQGNSAAARREFTAARAAEPHAREAQSLAPATSMLTK